MRRTQLAKDEKLGYSADSTNYWALMGLIGVVTGFISFFVHQVGFSQRHSLAIFPLCIALFLDLSDTCSYMLCCLHSLTFTLIVHASRLRLCRWPMNAPLRAFLPLQPCIACTFTRIKHTCVPAHSHALILTDIYPLETSRTTCRHSRALARANKRWLSL